MEALTTLKTEINHLSFTPNEQDSLCKYFTRNVEQINVVVTFLPDYTTDDEKRGYLKSLISTPEQPIDGNFPNVTSLQRAIEDVRTELNLKMESEFKKVHNALETSLYSPGFVTETDKDKEVRDKGSGICFPLKVTESTKPHAPGKFSLPPNKNSTDVSEKDIQDYFMNECGVLRNYVPIKNKLKLTVEDTRNSPVLGT
ncbi:kinase-like domain-containing protein [Rhizophagus clarus]|uniref:Kinase-like domain-containing protein n=1 Tax=Rhizophagus clarus TaxID=94130 RepID=A0A8H3QYE2_9GLOM|nr:kinase-like domain-containing protein [Rhizophagus clarus]